MKRKASFLIYLFSVIGLCLIFAAGCKKDDNNNSSSNNPPIDTVTDIDGNVYHTITIGTQVWMIENLRVTHFNDGTPIPNVTDGNTWINSNSPGYCWYNNDQATYGNIYGALYNWYAVSPTANGNKNIAPAGWHVPSDVEFTTLENYLIASGYNYDGTNVGNKIAKALASTSNWNSSTNLGTPGNTDYASYRNKSGFSALPGGYRYTGGLFGHIGQHGYFWTSTESDSIRGWQHFVYYDWSYTSKFNNGKMLGMSVRCIKN